MSGQERVRALRGATTLDVDERGHLFERIHGKDPYLVVEYLRELGWGSREYRIREVE